MADVIKPVKGKEFSEQQNLYGGIFEYETPSCILRGINISGKNKVPMAELKSGFESLDFAEVKTSVRMRIQLFDG